MFYFKQELSVCINVVSFFLFTHCVHPSSLQVGSVEVPVGLFPAVGMHSMGEEVKVDLQAEWFLEVDDSMMMVDSHEDDWGRLFDVRVSGTVRSRKGHFCFVPVKAIHVVSYLLPSLTRRLEVLLSIMSIRAYKTMADYFNS